MSDARPTYTLVHDNGSGHDPINPAQRLELLMQQGLTDDAQTRLKQTVLWGALVALLAAVAYSSFYTVEPDGKAVVKRFGAVVDIADPGLHFKLPLGIDTATFVPTERVLKQEFGFRTVSAGQRTQYRRDGNLKDESLMLTGDLNVLDVEWVVQYQISDPDKYLHSVRDRTETIRDVSEAVMRRVVGNRLGSDVLTVARVSVANEVQEAMQVILDDYEMGVHLAAVELQDVTPPEPVKPAFNAVNEARQERERLINEAEKERNRIIPRAKGTAEQVVAEANAYRTERVNEARGAASRFSSILTEYRLAKEVTRRRLFLEMIDDVIPKVGTLYVVDGGATTGALPLLDLDKANPKKKESAQP